ncbi:D-alanyl-D-alanine carboxypeptidase family protein [Streptomyces sp. NPDC058657]|uniref:D-alanyl-D-alanine carboxypeptidase family protein n=1 Tax=unclassified Streptomyces TaxID=2593676 RepID=UPI0036646866
MTVTSAPGHASWRAVTTALATTAALLLLLPASGGLLAAPAAAAPAPAPASLASDASDASDTSGTSAVLAGRAVSALAWIVADVRTGDVIAAHRPHRRLPPASTLKALFAVTALPRVPGSALRRVTTSDLAGVGSGSSVVGVRAGRVYRAADLWRGAFLRSGNDAVHVLAAMNGGWKSTVAQMQAKARALGARDTRVVTADGYDAKGQYSSAYDLALIGRAGLENAQFEKFAATARARFPSRTRADGSHLSSYPIRNTNRLLTGADGITRYRGLIGIKNGYTSKAGNTLIAAARRGDRTLIVTVLNPQRGDGLTVYREARALLDWGFRSVGRVRVLGSLNQPRH